MASKKMEIEAPAKKGTSEGTDSILEDTNPRGKAQVRRQLSIRLPIETFEDIETLRMIRKCEGESWSANETAAQLIKDYVEQYRKEIIEFREKVHSR